MDEVQVELGRVIRDIHANYGGHLTGFTILCSKKEPDAPLQEVKAWFGGPPEMRFSLIIEAAKMALDQIMIENQCSILEGMRILEGRIFERKLGRDRQARDQRGKR